MSAKLRAAAARGKKRRVPNRTQVAPIGTHISPVMQKVQSLMPPVKAGEYLAYLTDQNVQQCRKVLRGERPENLELITALLRSDHGREVLFALMGDANPPWFAKYRSQLKAVEARQMAEAAMRAAEAATAEVFK
jgi:hypothetical protein